MANDVTINVTADTKQAEAQLSTFKKSGLANLVSGMADVAGAINVGKQAFDAVYQVVDKTITQYTTYADSMKKLSLITGTGTEATSRLIQAFDDLGVSQETTSAAMSTAARKGFVASIDNVANLADRYVALNTTEEKNALLIKELGRGGLELARVFEKGGAAIRAASDAQGDGMIITEANAREAEKLRVAQDNLDDAVRSVENSVAKLLVPALTDLINSTQHATITSDNMVTELAKIPPQQRAGAVAAMEYREAQERANREGKNLVDLVGPMTEGIAGYSGALEQAKTAAVDPMIAAQDTLNTSMQTYSRALLFQIASQDLDNVSKAALALQMGLINEKSAYAISQTAIWKKQLDEGAITVEEYARKVNSLANAWDRIQSKQVTLTIDTVETGGGNRRVGGAVGFDGYASGTSFIIPNGYHENFPIGPRGGASSGERVTVTPASQSSGSSESVALLRQIAAKRELDPAMLARLLRDAIQQVIH